MYLQPAFTQFVTITVCKDTARLNHASEMTPLVTLKAISLEMYFEKLLDINYVMWFFQCVCVYVYIACMCCL